MKTAGEVVKTLADYLDQIGKPDASISVVVTRRTLLRHFKTERGAPVKCGKHVLVPVERSDAHLLKHQPGLLKREVIS